ncbi:MAG: hypothetical protein LBR30_02380 [Clostridioides sp.]|jgi:vacuolar-type H+-ATPase subunit H|nr:hypothetical protein [Clostridioides sp.]
MKIDLELLDLFTDLENIVKEANTLPFTQKCTVDKEEVLALLAEIKSLIPEEISQAVWINKERQKLISEAKKDASAIVQQAHKDYENIMAKYDRDIEMMKRDSEAAIKKYIESSDPVVKAREEAKEIIEKAENIAKEIRTGSMEYAEGLLSSVEYNLQTILGEIRTNKKELK